METSWRYRVARLALVVLPSVIVLVCVGATTAVAMSVQRDSIRETTAERVSDVSSELAELDQIVQVLESAAEREQATAELQPIASIVERAAGVDYVVVMTTDSIRITHPVPDERGRPVSTDSGMVLSGESVLEMDTGTIGRTLRAKHPVLDAEGNVIGAISAGMLESRMADDVETALWQLLPWAAGALAAGLVASSAVAAAIRSRLRRHDAAARELEQVGRTAAALREQAHEFDTRLHVVRGLVAHGDTGEAVDYIDRSTSVSTPVQVEASAGPPLLRATIEALRTELSAAGAALETAIDVTGEVDDAVMLVLANLCRNAGEAGAARVRCELHERDGRISGVVEDDGPGIGALQRVRMFARGYSSKPDITGTGRGIGLDMVRRTVAARRGTIEVSTSGLGGARFAFEMEGSR
ncbi:sensor histidine kinase [Microbacterium halotolerans]|uniref:sensor histidine kinase n=1 Tax=Microbacterium halotolerans TaxID=246613 RepID=UPI001F09E791|nr:ATP-binding protein [Microbacterium halotolerans]